MFFRSFSSVLPRSLTAFLFIIIGLVLAACGGGSDSPAPDPIVVITTNAELVAIEVSLPATSVVNNTEIAGFATGIYSDNNKIDISDVVSWSSSNELIASVTNLGRIQATTAGTTTISIGYENFVASTTLSVTEADLVRISLSPNSGSFPIGTRNQLTATGHFSNNTTQNISSQVSWFNSDTNVASISASGIITGISLGSTTITASHENISGSSQYEISLAQLTELTIYPLNLQMAAGTQQTISTQGKFSDGSIHDLSQDVLLSVTNTQIAEFSPGISGLLISKLPGNITVTASYAGISTQADIVVTDAALLELIATPPQLSLPAGLRTKVNVSARFSDNTIQDVTSQVSWLSLDTNIASTNNGIGSEGEIDARAPGNTTVQISLGDISTALNIDITNDVLTAIKIDPINTSVAAGSKLNLRAFGDFSDGSIREISNDVAWSTTNLSFATVDFIGNSIFLAALQAGALQITASLESIIGTSELTITDAVVTNIVIDQADTEIPLSTEFQFTATASYSDNSSQDVTDSVIWVTNNSSIAAFSYAKDSLGLVSALNIGSTTVTATLADSTISANTMLTITGITLDSISLNANDSTITNNMSTQLTATGHYSDGSTVDISKLVTWISNDNSIVSVSNSKDSQGLATGIFTATPAANNVNIEAIIYDSDIAVQSSITLAVEFQADKPISASIVASPNIILNDGIDTTVLSINVKAAATGSFVADGTIVDIVITSGSGTLSTAFTSTITGTAQVSFNSTDEGVVNITASIAGSTISNSTKIRVTPSLANSFAGIKYAFGPAPTTQVEIGTQFWFYLINLSNRDFTLPRFEFADITNNISIDSLDDPNRAIKGGGIIRAGYIADSALPLSTYAAQLTIYDPISTQQFILAASYIFN